MAEIARGELTAQELLSHEMGLHTEKLRGRSHQIFFDFDLNSGSVTVHLAAGSITVRFASPPGRISP